MSEKVKLIIEIPKDIYERCKEYKLWSYDAETLEGAVATSKPLSENKGEDRPKGHWIRMSDLPEDKDDRYKCSQCGNVVHHSNGVNLYTFNSWCGRCGSLNNSLLAELESYKAESEEYCTKCECKEECDGIEYMSKDQCEKKRGWQ